MSEPIKWLYYDITKARYVDDEDSASYLISNPGSVLTEVSVEASNSLPSGTGVGLIPEELSALIRHNSELYDLAVSGNNLLLSKSGSNIVEGFLPLSGGVLTGSLILNSDPSLFLEAATKGYVDALDASDIETTSSGIYYSQLGISGINAQITLDQIVEAIGSNVLTSTIFVKSLSDFPSPSGNIIYLDENISYILSGHVDIGDNRIIMSSGSIVRGLNEMVDTLYSTTTDCVLTASGQDVIIRDMRFTSPNGLAIEFTGPTTKSVYIDRCRFIGCKYLGCVDGFESIYFNRNVVKSDETTATTSGLNFNGNNNHAYISSNEFENLPTSGVSALTFQNNYVTDFTVISQNSFDITNEGTGITFEPAVSGARIVVRDNDFEGTTYPISGAEYYTPGYEFNGNSGVIDSNLKGGYTLSGSSLTVISAIDTPVKVSGTTTVFDGTERFEHTVNNRLTYTGTSQANITCITTFSVTGSNNTIYNFYIYQNGNQLPESKAIVKLSVGSDQRSGATSDIIILEPGDYIEIFVENHTNTSDVVVENLQVVVKG